jgi:hypothetical protein
METERGEEDEVEKFEASRVWFRKLKKDGLGMEDHVTSLV